MEAPCTLKLCEAPTKLLVHGPVVLFLCDPVILKLQPLLAVRSHIGIVVPTMHSTRMHKHTKEEARGTGWQVNS